MISSAQSIYIWAFRDNIQIMFVPVLLGVWISISVTFIMRMPNCSYQDCIIFLMSFNFENVLESLVAFHIFFIYLFTQSTDHSNDWVGTKYKYTNITKNKK